MMQQSSVVALTYTPYLINEKPTEEVFVPGHPAPPAAITCIPVGIGACLLGAPQVITLIMDALKRQSTRSGHTIVLEQIRGYLKRRLAIEEKSEHVLRDAEPRRSYRSAKKILGRQRYAHPVFTPHGIATQQAK